MTQQDRLEQALPATTPERSQLPFAGLRVLDVSQGISGPYCAHILWQQGAEVVKVEPPSGDWARGMGILREGTSSLAIAFNGGKQAICIDATQPQGREVLQRLAAQADVIIENFRPGVAARLGLDAAVMRAARPELIFVSISGYGTHGPYAGAPATDSVVQADAGLMFCNRGSDSVPRKIGVYLADMNSGLYAAQAVGAALYRRATGGQGAHIELNLFETCAATLVCNFVEHAMEPQRETMPIVAASAPNGTFEASDGSINLVTLNNEQFVRVCQALGQPQWADDPRFADPSSRLANAQAITALIAGVMKSQPVAHWSERFRQFDVLHAPVRSFSQCVDHPQARHLGTFESLAQPGIGTVAWAGTPVRSLRRPTEAAPMVGEHTEAVLTRAGFTEQQRQALARSGVTRQR